MQTTSQIHSRPFEKCVERRTNPNMIANAIAQMTMMRHANGRRYG